MEVTASQRAGQLIFSLAGSGPRQAASPIDWPQLLVLAQREQALVALRDHCTANPALLARPEWGHRLALLVLDSRRRMHAVRRRIEDTLVALNEAQVTPLLLKGAAMGAAYGAWDRRSMRDIDLLVSHESIGAARRAAAEANWIADHSLPDEYAYGSHHHEPPLLDGAGSGLRLEIHRSLFPDGHPFAIDAEEIQHGCRRIVVGEGHALVMQPHLHAVHIATHFVWSHQARAGAWNAFADLDVMLRADAFRWPEVVRVAARWRARSCLYWTLRLGRALSGLAVPDDVLDELAPITSQMMLDRLERHFIGRLLDVNTEALPPRLEHTLWSVAVQPRLEGHGESRPWSVSPELRDALGEPVTAPSSDAALASPPLRKLAQLKQSVLYLSKLV